MKTKKLFGGIGLALLTSTIFLSGCANPLMEKAETAQAPQTRAVQTPQTSAALPAHILTGYWQNFNNGATVLRISEVPTTYNLICVSFADATATEGAITFNLDPSLGFTVDQFKADIAAVKARGQHVIISVGGQNGTIRVANATAATNFANSVKSLMTTYGFEGVDIDLENGINATYMAQALRALPAGSIITMAPQTIDMQSTGMEYFKLALAIKDILTVCNMQYYNSGSMLGYDGKVYSQGSVDFLTALATIQLENGLEPSQVGLGLPASTSGAGSGYVTPTVIIQALDRLAYGTAYGSFVPPRKYPTIRGVMTWSINWDASNNWQFSNAIGAKLTTMNGTPQDTTPPNGPASLSSLNVTSTSISISWPAATDNVGVAGYLVSWGSGSKTVTGTSTTITDLTASTTYSLSVKAFDTAGNYGSAATLSVKTGDSIVDTIPPTVPQNLAASGVTSNSINLSWSASSDNVGVTGYDVYMGGSLKTSVPSNSTTISGLAADTSYSFQIRAKDAAGNASALSSILNAKTLAGGNDGPATGVPGTPSLSQSTWNGEASYTITMNMWWGNNGTTFELYENGSLVSSKPLTDNSPNSQTTSVSFSGKANGTYSYVGKLINRFGTTSSNALSYTVTKGGGDTQAPSVPGNLAASGVTSNSVNLSWSASSDNVGVTGYVVSWSSGSQTVTGLSAAVSGLSASTAYTFSVKATDAAGNQSSAATVNVTTQSGGGDTYPAWAMNTYYAIGTKVSFQGSNYQCALSHTSYSETWNPAVAPTLWIKL